MNQFELVTTTLGVVSIRDNRVNEIMHNPVGPWVEANALYVNQSQLSRRLQAAPADELVLFDVGLGAGSNAIAAIHTALELGTRQNRVLRVISFENNLDLLKFARLHCDSFAHMAGYETALEQLLTHSAWQSACGRVHWELRSQDFLQAIRTEKKTPDLIYFDPYSPNVNPEMWTLQCFENLRSACHPESARATSELYTYSRATPVRVALLLAGFYVGSGKSTGLKTETTQASTRIEGVNKPLDARWFLRWQRSHTPLPFGAPPNEEQTLRRRVTQHPQFISIEKSNSSKPVVFFDGVCSMCNGFVDFLLRADKKQVFLFAPFQSETARKMRLVLDEENASVVFYDAGATYRGSDAVLRILSYLGAGWGFFSVLRWTPRSIRDFFYYLVARNRYRWFGKKTVCRVPSESEKARFLS